MSRFGSPGSVVDEGVLEQRAEDEEDADAGPDVDGLGVGDGREAVLDAGLGGGHGQQGGHPQGHPGGHRLVVQPEGHPGHRHRHRARHVHRHHKERQLAHKEQLHPEAGVSPGGGDHVTILAAVRAQLEAPRQGEVTRQLDRLAPRLPDVIQVVFCPAI